MIQRQDSGDGSTEANKDSNLPPAFIANQWKPGQSGNPKGRPKGKTLTAAIDELLDADVKGEQMRKALARVAVQRALQGDFKFYSLVMDRRDGKVPDQLQQDGTLDIRVVYEDAPPRG